MTKQNKNKENDSNNIDPAGDLGQDQSNIPQEGGVNNNDADKIQETSKDQILRLLAEMDNVKKRAAKDVKDASEFSIVNLVKALIPVIENFYLAVHWAPKEQLESSPELKNFFSGIEMTRDELVQTLQQQKVFRYMPEVGELFDHHVHCAVNNIEDASLPNNSIAQVMQAGYNVGDRVVKHALVVVVKNN